MLLASVVISGGQVQRCERLHVDVGLHLGVNLGWHSGCVCVIVAQGERLLWVLAREVADGRSAGLSLLAEGPLAGCRRALEANALCEPMVDLDSLLDRGRLQRLAAQVVEAKRSDRQLLQVVLRVDALVPALSDPPPG